jgi:hypothetical protein
MFRPLASAEAELLLPYRSRLSRTDPMRTAC